jgi:hypothetical protein
MLANITRLELRLRRRSAIGYAAGMALYTLVVVALYPSFKNSTSLNSLGTGTGLAAASYLLSSLAATISGIRPGRYLSLFYWSVGNDQISNGVSITDFTVLTLTGLCALIAAVAAFRQADLN